MLYLTDVFIVWMYSNLRIVFLHFPKSRISPMLIDFVTKHKEISVLVSAGVSIQDLPLHILRKRLFLPPSVLHLKLN